MAKNMAIGAVLSTVRDVAKRSLPDISPHIDQVMNSAMHKFGVDADNNVVGKEDERWEGEGSEPWRRTPSRSN
jgi:hypothetical protein